MNGVYSGSCSTLAPEYAVDPTQQSQLRHSGVRVRSGSNTARQSAQWIQHSRASCGTLAPEYAVDAIHQSHLRHSEARVHSGSNTAVPAAGLWPHKQW